MIPPHPNPPLDNPMIHSRTFHIYYAISASHNTGLSMFFQYPVNTKHLYNIYTMLDRRFINVIQMFCVYWVVRSCGVLVTPADGDQTFTSTLEGGVANFSCDSGYTVVGSAVRTCEFIDGEMKWSGEKARCRGKQGLQKQPGAWCHFVNSFKFQLCNHTSHVPKYSRFPGRATHRIFVIPRRLSQQTRNVCVTFVQCWTNVEDVVPAGRHRLQSTHINTVCETLQKGPKHLTTCNVLRIFLKHSATEMLFERLWKMLLQYYKKKVFITF